MITTLSATTTDRIVSELIDQGAAAGRNRVLTLLVSTDADGLEDALEAAHGASRDHPCRVVAVVMCRTFLLTHLSVVARRGAPVLTDHCGARRGCSRPRGAIFHIVRCRLTCRTRRRPARSRTSRADIPGRPRSETTTITP